MVKFLECFHILIEFFIHGEVSALIEDHQLRTGKFFLDVVRVAE